MTNTSGAQALHKDIAGDRKVPGNLHKYVVNIQLLYTRKLDTGCHAMRQDVVQAKFQPNASQMHLKQAEICYCTQYAVVTVHSQA